MVGALHLAFYRRIFFAMSASKLKKILELRWKNIVLYCFYIHFKAKNRKWRVDGWLLWLLFTRSYLNGWDGCCLVWWFYIGWFL